MVVYRKTQRAIKHDGCPSDSHYRHPYQFTQASYYRNFTVWLLVCQLQTDTVEVCEYCILLGL